MATHDETTNSGRLPGSNRKIIGQMPPLKSQNVRSIRTMLKMVGCPVHRELGPRGAHSAFPLTLHGPGVRVEQASLPNPG